MKDNSFANVMNQIAAEDQAIRQREENLLERQRKMSKVWRVLASLLWLAMFATAFYYHKELQQFANDKFLRQPNINKMAAGLVGADASNDTNRSTGQNLKFISEQASKRDQILEESSKGIR